MIGLVALLTAMVLPAQARGAGDRLQATSQGGHVWFIIPAGSQSNEFDLCHHSNEMGGAFYKAQIRLPRVPIAMASWGDRLWLVFPPNIQASELRYEVFTVKVEENPALGVYFTVPAGSMDIAPPLPGQWDLESMVATSEGPMVLLAPQIRGHPDGVGRQAAGVRATQPSISDSRLMLLRGESWIDIDLPAGFDGRFSDALLPTGADGLNITLIEGTPGPVGTRYAYQDKDGRSAWTQSSFEGDVQSIRDRTIVLGQPVVSTESTGDTSVELALVRTSNLLRLATIPKPTNPWAMASTGSALMVLEDHSGKLQRRLIDPMTGESSEVQPLIVQPLTTGRIWQVSLLLAVSISGLLLVFLIRPAPSAPITFEKGVQALPGHLRMAAVIIDLFPAALVTMLVLRCSLVDLLSIPLMTIDIERTFPYLLMAAMTAAHSMISELIWSTSLGKGILEARIVQANGTKPRSRQILLRSLVKLIVLIIPPLALFALISPHMQGLDDLAAGTVVVHDEHEASGLIDDE